MRESVDSADEDKDTATEKDTEKLDNVNSAEVKMEGVFHRMLPLENEYFTNMNMNISQISSLFPWMEIPVSIIAWTLSVQINERLNSHSHRNRTCTSDCTRTFNDQ